MSQRDDKLRCCARCEYVYWGKEKPCPKCEFASYGAAYVYASKFKAFVRWITQKGYNRRVSHES